MKASPGQGKAIPCQIYVSILKKANLSYAGFPAHKEKIPAH